MYELNRASERPAGARFVIGSTHDGVVGYIGVPLPRQKTFFQIKRVVVFLDYLTIEGIIQECYGLFFRFQP